MDSRESGSDVDLESGGEAETSSEEKNDHDQDQDSDSGCKQARHKMLTRFNSGHMAINTYRSSTEGIEGLNLRSFGENLGIYIKGVGEKLEEKKKNNEKRKKTIFKKHPKPPRPPGGPSLDAADMRFVNEISELTRLTRTSRERMKAFKRTKANNKAPPSSNINLIAMVITIVFFLVIIFQGILGSRE